MHYSLLAVCAQREGDCGNFPESQCWTSFVSSLLPSSLISQHTCIIKCSSFAIKKPLMCADSKKQSLKPFLVWLGQCKSALTVLRIEYILGINSTRLQNYFIPFTAACNMLCPNIFEMRHEPPYFSAFCWMDCWFPTKIRCTATSEICGFSDESCQRKHLLNGYVLIYEDKLSCE